MEFRVIIPVRYASSRLPGKALKDIGGKPMLQHVYERALASRAESVVIATDDERIQKVAEGFGAQVCMTSGDHQTGSERLAEAVVALGYEDDEVVVNVQGDEPLIPPEHIRKVAESLLQHDHTKVATLCERISSIEDLLNPNVVKVVSNRRGFAMYFSRAPIPWEMEGFKQEPKVMTGIHHRHIGSYAFRCGFLQDYLQWDSCPEGEIEVLEQLKVLWYGVKMHVAVCESDHPPLGVDTPEDLAKVRALMAE